MQGGLLASRVPASAEVCASCLFSQTGRFFVDETALPPICIPNLLRSFRVFVALCLLMPPSLSRLFLVFTLLHFHPWSKLSSHKSKSVHQAHLFGRSTKDPFGISV